MRSMGDRRRTAAVLSSTGGAPRQAFMVKIATGMIPWMAPKATLAGSPMPNSSSTTG